MSSTPTRAWPSQAACPGSPRGQVRPGEDRCVPARTGASPRGQVRPGEGRPPLQGSSDHVGAATEEDPGWARSPPAPPSQALRRSPSLAPDAGSPAPGPAMSQQAALVLRPFLSGPPDTLPR